MADAYMPVLDLNNTAERLARAIPPHSFIGNESWENTDEAQRARRRELASTLVAAVSNPEDQEEGDTPPSTGSATREETRVAEHTVVLYGASDDLIEVEGDAPGCDEYPAEDAHFVLVGAVAKVRVRVWYTRRGVWAVAAAPVEEDTPMLPVALTGSGYSARATVEGVTMVVREADADA